MNLLCLSGKKRQAMDCPITNRCRSIILHHAVTLTCQRDRAPACGNPDTGRSVAGLQGAKGCRDANGSPGPDRACKRACPNAIYHGSGMEKPVKTSEAPKQPSDAYRRAGVDIEAGNALVRRIAPQAAGTRRAGVMGGLGGFGALFDVAAAGYRDPLLVAATDGVGTKLKLAIESQNLDTVGIDLVAMCVNDLVVQGAEPLFFLDYFATGTLDVDRAARVINGIAAGCRLAGCALIGGETAEMPGLYTGRDFDLAGFAVGAVERDSLLTGQDIVAGDRVLGLASTGFHANGFSLVRKLVAESGLALDAPAPFEPATPLAEALLRPTRIYVPSCLAALRAGGLKGLAHITGGGLIENIPRILPPGLRARLDALSWPLPAAFAWARQAAAMDDRDLARTFNCGIGMICVANEADVSRLTAILQESGETVYDIGEIESCPDGKIDSQETVLIATETAWRA